MYDYRIVLHVIRTWFVNRTHNYHKIISFALILWTQLYVFSVQLPKILLTWTNVLHHRIVSVRLSYFIVRDWAWLPWRSSLSLYNSELTCMYFLFKWTRYCSHWRMSCIIVLLLYCTKILNNAWPRDSIFAITRMHWIGKINWDIHFWFFICQVRRSWFRYVTKSLVYVKLNFYFFVIFFLK